MAPRHLLTITAMGVAIIAAALFMRGCDNVPGNGSANAAPPAKDKPLKKEKFVIGGHTFELELAIDDESRTKGLMGRDHIDENGGMMFVFPDSRVTVQRFWMKNCLVDMDIIYLDRRGTITAIHRMKMEPPQRADETNEQYEARLPGYTSGYPAQFAIELKSGWLDRLNVKRDQRIELDLARLKAMAR